MVFVYNRLSSREIVNSKIINFVSSIKTVSTIRYDEKSDNCGKPNPPIGIPVVKDNGNDFDSRVRCVLIVLGKNFTKVDNVNFQSLLLYFCILNRIRLLAFQSLWPMFICVWFEGGFVVVVVRLSWLSECKKHTIYLLLNWLNWVFWKEKRGSVWLAIDSNAYGGTQYIQRKYKLFQGDTHQSP